MRDDTPQEKRDKKSVGQKMQRFRDEMGLSQLQMAERMGPKYNRKSVSKYENGSDHMRIGALFTLCDIFGVSLEELGPDRLLSDQNKLLEDYRSLNLKNREMFKSFLDYRRKLVTIYLMSPVMADFSKHAVTVFNDRRTLVRTRGVDEFTHVGYLICICYYNLSCKVAA